MMVLMLDPSAPPNPEDAEFYELELEDLGGAADSEQRNKVLKARNIRSFDIFSMKESLTVHKYTTFAVGSAGLGNSEHVRAGPDG
jgi:hypothetical protein